MHSIEWVDKVKLYTEPKKRVGLLFKQHHQQHSTNPKTKKMLMMSEVSALVFVCYFFLFNLFIHSDDCGYTFTLNKVYTVYSTAKLPKGFSIFFLVVD